MTGELFFILELAIILCAANLGGYISEKLKQPAVLGQIVAGLILGSFAFHNGYSIEYFAQIGVIMLMFIAGLETDVKELIASLRSSSLIAFGGVLLPIIMVMGGKLLLIPDGGFKAALFLGIVTTATSVSISVQTLREIDRLRTKQGLMILGGAIIDDVVGIILITLMVGLVSPGASKSVGFVVLDILILFIAIIVLGFIILKVIKFLESRYDVEGKIISFAIILCLGLAFLSEELGVAAITGAYFAGIIMSMTKYRHRISHDVDIISSTIFMPIFFVSIGMSINIVEAIDAIALGSIMIIMGSLGKIIGCGVGARLSSFSREHSLQIGIGMVPRAEVALIVANLGLRMGILGAEHIAATVLMVLVTTLITPPLLKLSFKKEGAEI